VFDYDRCEALSKALVWSTSLEDIQIDRTGGF